MGIVLMDARRNWQSQRGVGCGYNKCHLDGSIESRRNISHKRIRVDETITSSRDEEGRLDKWVYAKAVVCRCDPATGLLFIVFFFFSWQGDLRTTQVNQLLLLWNILIQDLSNGMIRMRRCKLDDRDFRSDCSEEWRATDTEPLLTYLLR